MYWQDEHERWRKRLMCGQEDLPTFTASLFQLACWESHGGMAESHGDTLLWLTPGWDFLDLAEMFGHEGFIWRR